MKFNIMKKLTLTMVVCITAIVGLSAQIGTGLLEPNKYLGKFKEKSISSLGFTGTLPTSYSLKKYTPYPKNQGNYGTCASWATA